MLNIPSDLRNINNNYVTINNTLLQDKKVFQIYPVNIRKIKIKKNPKIIFISRIDTKTNIEEKNIWENSKEKLLQDFTLIDNKRIWEEIFPNDNELAKFNLYRKLKLLIRFEIIKKIKATFNDRLNLIGDDWVIFFNSSNSNYNTKKIKEIYKGNICLDLGSMLGSSSLYSRSNQIIESGGLIIQSYQNDGKKIWKSLDNKILIFCLLKFNFLHPKAIAPELTRITFFFCFNKSLISFANSVSHLFLIFLFLSIIIDDPIFITIVLDFLRYIFNYFGFYV